MPAEYDIRIDWNGDGDFNDPLENVTDRALARTPVTIQYGRDQDRAIPGVASGSGGCELDNSSRDYSPENTASPLADNLLPARPVRVQATVASTAYTLLYGHTDDAPIRPDIETRSVSFGFLDALAKVRGQDISTPLYQGVRTGDAVNLVLDAVGWPTSARDIDPGATVIPWWWEEQGDAFDALTRILDSEGPPALLTIGPDGEIMFRDRHHRLLDTASTTSQATWRGSPPEPVMARGLVYDNGWAGIANDVTFSVTERQPSPTVDAVWSTDATMSLSDGEITLVRAQATDPFFDAVTPVAGTDYTLVSGVVTASLSRTSGQATTILLTASGGPAVLRGLRLRATSVPVARTVQVQAEDSTSIAAYGRRSWPKDAPWAGVYDARAIASIVLAHRAERLPVITARFVGTNDTRLAHMLGRDLSDRVTIIEPELGVDGDFHIERINHSFDGDLGHETLFTCEKAPTQVSDVFILGSATNGVLGTNRLGKRGLADPATMFILGSASNGVLGANILGV